MSSLAVLETLTWPTPIHSALANTLVTVS